MGVVHLEADVGGIRLCLEEGLLSGLLLLEEEVANGCERGLREGAAEAVATVGGGGGSFTIAGVWGSTTVSFDVAG